LNGRGLIPRQIFGFRPGVPEISPLLQRAPRGCVQLPATAAVAMSGADHRKVIFAHVANPLGNRRDVNPTDGQVSLVNATANFRLVASPQK